ncbi:MAG TPA: hypothetical protein VK427_24235 [Kofleriaceae bacterium]|nr:hypothetical protein [Kofleriaceae bacterium]
MNRALLLLLLPACDDGSASPRDASTDASTDASVCEKPAPALFAGIDCMPNGLANAPLEQLYRLAGTQTVTRGTAPNTMVTTRPVDTQVTLHRSGSGWCAFDLAVPPATPMLSSDGYANGTFAYTFSQNAGRWQRHQVVCVSNGALRFYERETGYAQQIPYSASTDAALTP